MFPGFERGEGRAGWRPEAWPAPKETSKSCSSVAPNESCGDFNEAGGGHFRYCTLNFVGSKTYVRAAFCNRTDDVCVPLQ